MTMSVHDACEAWAEGRLPIERALELTGAADVGELLIICYQCEVPRPLLTGPPPAEQGYSPESIRVLAGMERPARDPDDPIVRWANEFLEDPPGGDGPFVGGTRIPAATILAYVRAGYPDAEIHADYPTLPIGGVDAVRRWAAGLGDELPED